MIILFVFYHGTGSTADAGAQGSGEQVDAEVPRQAVRGGHGEVAAETLGAEQTLRGAQLVQL